jgi:multiple sugar transport system permease protein/putative chitobiose transport system permease protein
VNTIVLPEAPVDDPVASRPSRRRRRRGGDRINVPATAVAVLLGVIFILPAVWILIGSLRPATEIFGSLSPLSWRLLFPSAISFDNYVELIGSGFGRALLNSAIVCLATVVIGVVVSATASYALAVLRFPGRGAVFAFVVISFMVPFEAIAIPLSGQFTEWNLTNTMIGLILPGIGNGLAIFNLRQFFLGVPESLREAAKLDGASEPRILWSVYVPNSGAALTNSALLIFLGQWTSYLWPLLVVSDPELQVAPIALAKTFSEHTANFGQNFAGAVLLSLVPAVLMFTLQKFFGGLSMTSGEK